MSKGKLVLPDRDLSIKVVDADRLVDSINKLYDFIDGEPDMSAALDDVLASCVLPEDISSRLSLPQALTIVVDSDPPEPVLPNVEDPGSGIGLDDDRTEDFPSDVQR